MVRVGPFARALTATSEALLAGGQAVVGAARTEAQIVAELPATTLALLRAVRTVAEGAEDAVTAARQVKHLAARLEGLLDEVEQPLQAASPGLRRVSKLFADPNLGGIPDALRGFKETQERVAAIAASTERITSLVDDAGSRLGSLPGLLRRPFRVPEPPPVFPPAIPLPPAEH